MSARARWWFPHLGLAALALAGAVVNAVQGQLAVMLVSVALAALLVRSGQLARYAYKSGWHDGFREGLMAPLADGTPAWVVRVKTTGCACPEIWDRPPEPGPLPRRPKAEKGPADE